MNTIRYIDLLANEGQLRTKFEKAFTMTGGKVTCVLTSKVDENSIYVYEEGAERPKVHEISSVKSEDIPSFDFLLAGFPSYTFPTVTKEQGLTPIENLFTEVERILRERKPYGFIIENIEGLIEFGPLGKVSNVNEKLHIIVNVFKKIGYKMSWRVLDNEQFDVAESSKKVFLVGTLGSATVLADVDNSNQHKLEHQSDFVEMLVRHQDAAEIREKVLGEQQDPTQKIAKVQAELLNFLLEENRRKSTITPIENGEQPKSNSNNHIENKVKQQEKQVYFKLYPPKKLTQITEEDGSVTGLVHSFIFQEVFEETVKELDFARDLNSDLKALFTSSGEQILVIDGNGIIIRVSGTFFSEFWQVEHPDDIIGKEITELTNKRIFQPNIFNLCKKKKDKVTAIQESANRQIWSIATPVYEDGRLTKVIVLSKEITNEEVTSDKTETSLQVLEDSYSLSTSEDRKLIYRSEKIKNLLLQLTRVAKMNSTVLLEGETGVGKEVFAHRLHKKSARSHEPLIRINCGAIPEQLIESELFGYEKGAFTGADRNGKIGYFELAHNGTIFLDEIGELPFTMQVKLLRVLQEREVTRIGGTHPISIDVRIIAATNQNLKELVGRGEFREDLYYRLNVVPFKIPSLRERREDIFPLALHFLEQQKSFYNMEKSFHPEAIEVLETYDWPGNVRELQNIIERLLIYNDEEWIMREDVLNILYGGEEVTERNVAVFKLMPLKEAVAEVEAQLIELGMKKYATAAELSKELGISPATLSRKMKNNKKKF